MVENPKIFHSDIHCRECKDMEAYTKGYVDITNQVNFMIGKDKVPYTIEHMLINAFDIPNYEKNFPDLNVVFLKDTAEDLKASEELKAFNSGIHIVFLPNEGTEYQPELYGEIQEKFLDPWFEKFMKNQKAKFNTQLFRIHCNITDPLAGLLTAVITRHFRKAYGEKIIGYQFLYTDDWNKDSKTAFNYYYGSNGLLMDDPSLLRLHANKVGLEKNMKEHFKMEDDKVIGGSEECEVSVCLNTTSYLIPEEERKDRVFKEPLFRF